MKTLMALVLSFGMVLLGTAPVMAAGQAMQAAAPLQQSKVVQVVVPETQSLSDSDIELIRGENPFVIAFVVGVAAGVTANIVYEKWIKPHLFPKPKPKPQKCKCKCSCEAETTCPANY